MRTPFLPAPAAPSPPPSPQVRITKGRGASESVVPRPDVLKQRRKPRPSSAGPADTPLKDAQEVTHTPGDLPSALKEQLAALAAAGHTPGAAGAAGGAQQQRQYSTGVGLLGGGASAVAAAAQRLLGGGRLRPLGSSWRGFAASIW